MALAIADVRARIETDLDDTTLQRILDAATKAVTRSAGNASVVTEDHDATGGDWVALIGPSTSITSITERRRHSSDAVTLSANDYRKVGPTRLLRLRDGDNPAACWGAEVIVVYVPEVDTQVRDRVTIDLCNVDIEFRAYDSEKSGGFSGSQKDYKSRRRELLRQVREGRSIAI